MSSFQNCLFFVVVCYPYLLNGRVCICWYILRLSIWPTPYRTNFLSGVGGDMAVVNFVYLLSIFLSQRLLGARRRIVIHLRLTYCACKQFYCLSNSSIVIAHICTSSDEWVTNATECLSNPNRRVSPNYDRNEQPLQLPSIWREDNNLLSRGEQTSKAFNNPTKSELNKQLLDICSTHSVIQRRPHGFSEIEEPDSLQLNFSIAVVVVVVVLTAINNACLPMCCGDSDTGFQAILLTFSIRCAVLRRLVS